MRAKALQEPWVTVQPWPRPRTKPHITNSESGTRKPSHEDTNLSRGSNPKFLRNIHLTKKHKKGLKKMQASNAKAMSVCRGHQESVNPRWPSPRCQWPWSQTPPSCLLAHPKLGNWIRSYLAKSHRLCSQSSRIKPNPGLGSSLGSSGAQALVRPA